MFVFCNESWLRYFLGSSARNGLILYRLWSGILSIRFVAGEAFRSVSDNLPDVTNLLPPTFSTFLVLSLPP